MVGGGQRRGIGLDVKPPTWCRPTNPQTGGGDHDDHQDECARCKAGRPRDIRDSGALEAARSLGRRSTISALSSATKRPVTEIVPEVAPPPPPAPTHAAIHIKSNPSGAEVIRLTDNRRLGTTPLVDIRLADGTEVNYRFHLPGHTDVQMPFQPTAAGRFEITATLSPVERRSDSHARGSAGSGRHGRHDKKQPAQQIAAPAQPPAPVAAQPPPAMQPATLPPLGDRNPVRRLGRR